MGNYVQLFIIFRFLTLVGTDKYGKLVVCRAKRKTF